MSRIIKALLKHTPQRPKLEVLENIDFLLDDKPPTRNVTMLFLALSVLSGMAGRSSTT